jgi:large subunit ribosomal protein L23
MDIYQVLIGPHITEKATDVKRQTGQVIFKVHKDANKLEIKQAVEKFFKVKVLDVRTIKVKGKKKRLGRFEGKKSDWKKAMVRLAPGQTIEFFEGL